MPDRAATTMKTLRFHAYGEPADVLRLEEADVPTPGPNHIRIRVVACGLTPADSALCRGLFGGLLPRGVGLEAAGTVDAVGGDVAGVTVGDLVLGVPDFVGYESAGASEFAILNHWAPMPDGLSVEAAAALPMAVETAYRSLDLLGVGANQTVVVNGAGSTVGFAAVQMTIMRGSRVIAIAGKTFADRLRGLGAEVTPYGEGVVDRVQAIAGEAVDLILDTAPVSGALPNLIEIAGGDPKRVLTISDFDSAAKLGVRTTGRDPDATMRYDVLGEYAEHAAAGAFGVPIARTFPLSDWRDAFELSLSGHAQGKLLLIPDRVTIAALKTAARSAGSTPATRTDLADHSRSETASRKGETPNARLYSRLNWGALA